MIKFIEKLLNLIYIQPCYFCKSTKEDTLLCSKCYNKIKHMPLGILKEIRCCNIYAATLYDGIIKNLVRDLKYHKKKQLAKVQAKLMYDYWKELNIEGDFIILPVPIHENRKKERHYNHMDIVADEFQKLSNYNINKDFLIRIKDTQKQFKLHRQERIKNIKDAFDIDLSQDIQTTSNLLILDDITSTGITLDEIIKVLKKNKYKNIKALTLATPDIWN